MKEKKYGLTAIEWILSIVGMIILTCVIIIPPIFRVTFKEEEKEPEIPEQVVVGTIECVKTNIRTADYRYTELLNITYANDNIQRYSINQVRIYNDSVKYLADKQLFGKYTAAFAILSGYKYSVEPDDNTYTLIVDEEFNLDDFKNTTITIPGDTEKTEVKTTYTRKDLIETVKNNLISNGYTCQ